MSKHSHRLEVELQLGDYRFLLKHVVTTEDGLSRVQVVDRNLDSGQLASAVKHLAEYLRKQVNTEQEVRL